MRKFEYEMHINTDNYPESGEYLCIGFNTDDNSENEAWKVAEKILSYFPQNASAELYDKDRQIWEGEVTTKDKDGFFLVSGRFL